MKIEVHGTDYQSVNCEQNMKIEVHGTNHQSVNSFLRMVSDHEGAKKTS